MKYNFSKKADARAYEDKSVSLVLGNKKNNDLEKINEKINKLYSQMVKVNSTNSPQTPQILNQMQILLDSLQEQKYLLEDKKEINNSKESDGVMFETDKIEIDDERELSNKEKIREMNKRLYGE